MILRRYKFFITFLLLLFLGLQTQAQKKAEDPYRSKTDVRKAKSIVDIADKYFYTDEYYLAAQEYLNAVKEDPNYIYALYRLAESFRLYFNYDQALSYYKHVIDKDSTAYPLARYWYANMLKNRARYEEAIVEYGKFNSEFPDSDPNASTLKEMSRIDSTGCQFAINELKKPVREYEFNNVGGPINTSNSDYAPAIFKNDTSVIITSARIGTIGDKEYNVLGGKFSDFFRFELGKDSVWIDSSSANGFKKINTDYNDGSGSFTADKKKFYFSRADQKFVSADFIDYLPAVYVTTLQDTTWSVPVKLNANINVVGEYNSEPSISPNGDTLYFVSKRPGGKGMHDIYYSVAPNKDDNWEAPVNIERINTPQIEKSPCYYAMENTLFFSSNGHEGFGGLDIYKATGPKHDTINNIGLPFNSNMDDFYFVLGEDKGYLSSNREGGLGNDDIYIFNIKSKEAIIAEINKDSLLALAASDSSTIKLSKADSLALANGDSSVLNKLKANELKSLSIEGTVLLDDSKKPAADVENKLKDKEGHVIKTTKTNDEGKFRFENLPVESYKVEIEDKDPSLTADVKYVVEDVKVKGSNREVSRVLFENIYFDFDKYYLRPEAKKVLRELAAFYKKHPGIQIEMNANTDSYGSDAYNKILSKNRGKSALDYLIKNKVDKSALVVTASGEGKPMVSNNSPAGRQLNRRIEFYILGGDGYDSRAMTYIADPNATIEQVAKKFNMTVTELKELNAMTGDEFTSYQPVRVRRSTGDNDIVSPMTLALVKAKTGDSTEVDPRMALNQASPEKYKKENSLMSGQIYYIVEPKNTLFSIARLFGYKVDEVKVMGNLKSTDVIIAQKVLINTRPASSITDASKYQAKEGDTLDSIAKQFGISTEQLVQMNDMAGYRLYPGMILKVK